MAIFVTNLSIVYKLLHMFDVLWILSNCFLYLIGLHYCRERTFSLTNEVLLRIKLLIHAFLLGFTDAVHPSLRISATKIWWGVILLQLGILNAFWQFNPSAREVSILTINGKVKYYLCEANCVRLGKTTLTWLSVTQSCRKLYNHGSEFISPIAFLVSVESHSVRNGLHVPHKNPLTVVYKHAPLK